MSNVSRRQFVGAASTAAVLLSQGRSVQANQVTAPPQVPLGKTGITMSRVGQGTGVHGGQRQSDQTRLGFDKLVALFRHAYDRGITFFDLADLYGTHLYFREALRSIPRENVTIMTKVWWRYDGPQNKTLMPFRKQVLRSTLERFLHELSTDHLDIVLLHCMTTKTWNDELQMYMEELTAAKERKQIRAVGVSCHDYGALQTAATSPFVDVVLARLNPKGVKMDGTPEQITAVLKEARDNGKAVIGMKIFGEGQLADERDACIQYAQASGVLDAMTIGFEEPEQIDDVLRLIEKYPQA